MGRTACTEPQCLYKGALYLTVELYPYSPCGPYGLYRASVRLYNGALYLFYILPYRVTPVFFVCISVPPAIIALHIN
jgi:hypothetical protein